MDPQNYINEDVNGLKWFRKKQGKVKYKFEFKEFVNVSFKNAELANSLFRHCTFRNCYFREAILQNTSLSGSTFHDCNFKETVFGNNMMENTTFYNCEMNERDAFDASIKTKFAPTSRLAKNLRINAYEARNKKSFFYMFRQEKKYLRKHNLGYVLPFKNEYYNEKRNWKIFFKSFSRLLKDTFDRLFWWYGYGMYHLLTVGFLTIYLFSIFYVNHGLSRLEGLLLSVTSFSTLGFVSTYLDSKITFRINQIMVIESFLGAIFIALFASVIFSRYTKIR
jgi:hypothetical protein